MILYHGTDAKNVPAILEQGLLPRGSGVGNWDSEFESHSKLVYLTVCYAPTFAAHCAGLKGAEKFAVVEVDTDKLDTANLRPDEDFIEQALRLAKVPLKGAKTMAERTRRIRDKLHELAPLWKESIKWMGNCAHYGAVPVDAIRRVAVVTESENLAMWMQWDPEISIHNHSWCGERYAKMTRWIFGEALTPEDIVGSAFPIPDVQRTELEKMIACRAGIEIVENGRVSACVYGAEKRVDNGPCLPYTIVVIGKGHKTQTEG